MAETAESAAPAAEPATLVLTRIAAYGLADGVGEVSVQVEIEGGATASSSSVAGSKNPEWLDELELDGYVDGEQTLNVTLWEQGEAPTKLGEASVKLTKASGLDATKSLTLKGGKKAAKLTFGYHVQPTMGPLAKCLACLYNQALVARQAEAAQLIQGIAGKHVTRKRDAEEARKRAAAANEIIDGAKAYLERTGRGDLGKKKKGGGLFGMFSKRAPKAEATKEHPGKKK